MIILVTILLTTTMLFSILCFLLVGAPERILGVIVYFANAQEDWHHGKIDIEREQTMYLITRKVEKIVIFALFGWSVFCGAMLGLVDLMM